MTDIGPFEDLSGLRWPSGVAIARAYAAQRDHFLRLYERAVRAEAPVAVEPQGEEAEPEPPPPVVLDAALSGRKDGLAIRPRAGQGFPGFQRKGKPSVEGRV